MHKIKGHSNLRKNPSNGVIVNTDTKGFQQFMRQREKALKTEDKISDLESEIKELKSMIKGLVNGN